MTNQINNLSESQSNAQTNEFINQQIELLLKNISVLAHEKIILIHQLNSLKQQVAYLKENVDITKLKPATDDLRKHQFELIDFANKFFDEVTKNIDIKPFLMGGNLLGAIRHKGFIPWDDDFDFGLIREDYEKLINYCREKYIVNVYDKQYSKYNPNVCKERFTSNMEKYPNTYILDIFHNQLQLYKGTSLSDIKYLDFWSFDFYKEDYTFEEHKKYLDYIKAEIDKLDYVDKIVSFLTEEIKNNPNIVKKSNKIYFGIDDNASWTKYDINNTFIDYDVIFPLKKIKYENTEFWAPNKEMEYVKYEYDDYMKFPDDFGARAHSCIYT